MTTHGATPGDDPYAAEAQERWPSQYAESRQRLRQLSAGEQAGLFDAGRDITARLGALHAARVPASDDAVQCVIGEHYAWVSAFWTPDHDTYVGLGRLYVDDPRFTKTYDDVEPGLAQFTCDAMAVWADEHLLS